MSFPLCYMLIGPPGCGKSTLARHWIEYFPDTVWISTDAIREKLYGDVRIQGDWSTIEAEFLQQTQAALSHQRSILYDATNARPDWRIDILQNVQRHQPQDIQVQWMGWVFQMPLAVCKLRNQMRDRQVDEAVIEQLHHGLEEHPPSIAEGFAAIHSVPMTGNAFDFETINLLIHTLQVSISTPLVP
ncbi:MAG: ATP-binding protein [Cyanobacteria bacterium J06626_14]